MHLLASLAHACFGVFYSSGFVRVYLLLTSWSVVSVLLYWSAKPCLRFVILLSQSMSSLFFQGGQTCIRLRSAKASALVHGDEIALVHADDKVELQRALPCSSTTGISRVSPFDGRITITTSSSSCPNTSHAQIVKLASNTLLHRGWWLRN